MQLGESTERGCPDLKDVYCEMKGRDWKWLTWWELLSRELEPRALSKCFTWSYESCFCPYWPSTLLSNTICSSFNGVCMCTQQRHSGTSFNQRNREVQPQADRIGKRLDHGVTVWEVILQNYLGTGKRMDYGETLSFDCEGMQVCDRDHSTVEWSLCVKFRSLGCQWWMLPVSISLNTNKLAQPCLLCQNACKMKEFCV